MMGTPGYMAYESMSMERVRGNAAHDCRRRGDGTAVDLSPEGAEVSQPLRQNGKRSEDCGCVLSCNAVPCNTERVVVKYEAHCVDW